ncbi:glycosyltransferase family 4 protein [Alkalinema sp. FACHB-956]|uniref:glycosyltransferase family 4 protein n=1 Tax=Alkalinema sp. FACHB-956 TaxID=2692768 RepID=UPI001689599F|nr:glycosyltransferase family 4 protein [Alkalinema sp. FACHB-956]MBD2327638.1 glycosyltransferase family 4 protein [Alkalinema sp. FACHB-956]
MQRYAFVFLEILSCEGGIQSYVRDILRAYPGAVPADVFLLRDGPEVENPFASDRLRFHYLKTKPASLGRLRLAVQFLAYLIRCRPQRVFCGHIHLAPLISPLCQALGIPLTILTYGKEVWEPLPPPKQKALQTADRVWTISRYSRDRLCAANGVQPDRVEFLYCAVDGQTFRPMEPQRSWLEQYGLANHRVMMTVARLWSGDPYKGVDVTIRALPKILAQYPDVKYLVIGRGDDQPRLAQLAAELGVADRVVFAGFVPTAELPQHYNLADIYVMPSQEGFGIVYLEAMACGVPVLSGDGDGSADPLQDGHLGWRVPYRDPEAVAIACCEMLAGQDPRCNGAMLREKVLHLFDRSALQARLAELLAQG